MDIPCRARRKFPKTKKGVLSIDYLYVYRYAKDYQKCKIILFHYVDCESKKVLCGVTMLNPLKEY